MATATLQVLAVVLRLGAAAHLARHDLAGVSHEDAALGNVGAGCGKPLPRLRCEADMLAWLQAGGGAADGVAAATIPGRGRGLVATKPLLAGQLAVRVPRALQMSYAASCTTPFAVALRLCDRLPGEDGLAVEKEVALTMWLLHERYAGAGGSWWPYIAALPSGYPGVEFSDGELAVLDQTVAVPHLLEHVRDVERLASAMTRIVAAARRQPGQAAWLHCGAASCLGTAGDEGGGEGERWGAIDLVWAVRTVKSRAWDDEAGAAIARPGPALVPAADLVNHGGAAAGVGGGGEGSAAGVPMLLGQEEDGARQLTVRGGGGLPIGGELLDLYLPPPHPTGRTGQPTVAAAHRSSIAHLAGSFGVFDPSYPLPVSMLTGPPGVAAGGISPANRLLDGGGCLQAGFLPLGVGWLAVEFAARLLGCLRLECAAKIADPAVITPAGTLTAVAAAALQQVGRDGTGWPWPFARAGAVGSGGGLAAAAEAVESCAGQKALANIGAELQYYPLPRPVSPLPPPPSTSSSTSPWVGIQRLEGERAGRRRLLRALLVWEGDAYRAVFAAIEASVGHEA